ncbi:MAG: SIS domain-containing protein [Candidatus Thermoplasmatota archaeon]|jgi:6-phospho-3-hexuloisomerase|nr:SIS domain-containing protein [Candidatus Thermoplasmatota archaeon]MCL5984532.1 SIS domain-containing protein [Candidatus Thermoplasmatota archaeon]
MPPAGSDGSSFKDAVSYIGDRVTEALKGIAPDQIARTVTLITTSPTIFVYGAGRSGIVGRAFAMRLVQAGMKAFVIGESVTPIVMRGDLVIIFSNRGESYSSNQTANIVRREGATLIVITARPTSKLAHAATLCLSFAFPEDPRRPVLAPLGTLFEAASLRLSDGLIAEVMKARGEDEDSLRRRHAIMV